MDTSPELTAFLLTAKKAAYAGGGAHAPSSRPASVDLPFQQGDYAYLDTYLGGYAFIGEEAVWLRGNPVWGMNYYGTMTVPEIPAGFSQFLKDALLRVPADAPYRGPHRYEAGIFTYTCEWEGSLGAFWGQERICAGDAVIYWLKFHGGSIQ